MQLALVRKWGQHTDYYVLAADDDQAIYWWRGATAEAVLAPHIPDDHKVVLTQSYRVPRRVHALANGLIRHVSRREEKVYAPRPEDGVCWRSRKAATGRRSSGSSRPPLSTWSEASR